ncbi:MAG: hypothetical protein ABEJ07_03525 [Candidatus Nanohaloarchaea archaeon]
MSLEHRITGEAESYEYSRGMSVLAQRITFTFENALAAEDIYEGINSIAGREVADIDGLRKLYVEPGYADTAEEMADMLTAGEPAEVIEEELT